MTTINDIGRDALHATSFCSPSWGERSEIAVGCDMREESVRDVQHRVIRTKTGSLSTLPRMVRHCSSLDFLPLLPGHQPKRLNSQTRLDAWTG